MNRPTTPLGNDSRTAILAGIAIGIAACGGSDAASTASASASASARGTTAASVAVTMAETPAASPHKVTMKLSTEGYDGDYDGSKVFFTKRFGGTLTLRLGKDCPKFSCSTFYEESMDANCPKGTAAEVQVPNKVGKTSVDMLFRKESLGYNLRAVDVEITQTTENEVRGKITKNADGHNIEGSFVGTFCKSAE